MDTAGFNPKLGSDSQDSEDLQQPAPPGVDRPLIKFSTKDIKLQPISSPLTSKGIDQAKKRLRAFSIQKKTSLSPAPVSKPSGSGIATVFIGKAAGVKSVLKPGVEPIQDDPKKIPKPPKPGGATESYLNTQKKTLAEIEDMKRKMELVELGIPLGLICPAPNSEWNKAMPTKAMPPIKTFLDREKVDELIREGKKARAEGREFKFDYRKLLPDYDNPFQRKRALQLAQQAEEERRNKEREKRRSDKYDSKRHSSHKSDDKYKRRDDKYKDRSKDNSRDKSRENKDSSRDSDKSREKKEKDYKNKDREERSKELDAKSKDRDDTSKELDRSIEIEKNKEPDVKPEELTKEAEKEAEVNLKDFVVCDSWSDNDEKSKDSTPKPDEVNVADKTPLYADIDVPIDPMKQLRESFTKKQKTDSPKPKLKRLNPDAVKFEVVEPDDDDDDDEDVLDMFDESSSLEKFAQTKLKKELDDSPMDQLFDFDDAKEETFEGMADDTFLESVINEIKQEEIDENSQDKTMPGYDESPAKDIIRSVTPEMVDRTRHLHSSRSDYSDGYKSTESGYKSTESVKISDCELESIVEERKRELELIEHTSKLNKYTEDSLDTWSFILKVCQPMLFRHDRNKCYKETRITPKLWYTENPKLCNCVKDRSVVYEELDVYKSKYLDTLYGSEQSPEMVEPVSRGWYPRMQQWPTPNVQAATEWEAEDSQAEQHAATPEQTDLSLDKEYQRFMATVRPDIGDTKSETPLSSPSRREATKKKADEPIEDKRSKRMKMASEGWSQESEQEEEGDKSVSKKAKEKRKRKHSTSTLTDSSESEPKKRKKTPKKKDNKKSKSKDSKRRRVRKKNIKKKEKPKKKKKSVEVDEDSDLQELEKEKKKKDKKLKKKKLLKQKKKSQKKKKTRTKSSSSDSSDSEPEKKAKKKKKKTDKKKKKKKSDAQEEQLFDVNILKNIKTERNSDEERSRMEFSPRRQKPREIINVKELQNDFVGNSIQIKMEVEEDEKRKVESKREDSRESQAERVDKEEEESQSTPQLRPDESNNSQCSSQESIYSLKDTPVYEKDESHLRPSSQNSNYSFHDVMASKYSKNKQIGQEKSHRYDPDSRSRESNSRDMRSQEHDMQSRDHEMQNQEYESQSKYEQHQEQEIRDRENYQYDPQSPLEDETMELRIPRHIRDIPRPDSRSCDHDIRSHEHDSRSRDHNIRSHEHDSRSHELDSRSHEVSNNERDISYKHDMLSHNNNLQSHDQSNAEEIDNQEYEQGNYEMYEQMAMAYQSDVAKQHTSPPDGSSSRPIETVVRARTCGEIKCDWRAGAPGQPTPAPAAPAPRPSRWGLKPGEVNIVLTGGQSPSAPQPVYRIQSLANRGDAATGYDEAYLDTYGASDKLQYGDCFSTESTERRNITPVASSLDDRINLALRTTVLGDVAKDPEEVGHKEGRDKGILVTKSLNVENRAPKRVSFADGYKPGQDSDVEEPPVKKKKKSRRLGCAWPCPASHADHVPLWDALPPPPPPPGSPPPPAPRAAPNTHLLRQGRALPGLLAAPPHHIFGNSIKVEGLDQQQFNPPTLAGFMPPEPPPGIIPFQNMPT